LNKILSREFYFYRLSRRSGRQCDATLRGLALLDPVNMHLQRVLMSTMNWQFMREQFSINSARSILMGLIKKEEHGKNKV